jgi:hypothetical protein
MATGSNSHSHPVKVGGKTYSTGSIGHQHTETPKPADALTAAEVAALKALLVAGGGGGGTAPGTPNPPPDPPLPPVISGIAISNVTTTGFTVSWTTDAATTGIVEYGTGTGYDSQTAATSSGTTHQRSITGLTAATTYHFRVQATNAGGVALSSDRTVTTVAVPAPPPGTSITVNSISALKAALANNTYTEIVVANGTYSIAPASSQATNSLNIGSAYASRTNPVTVRAETSGSVTFDGGGAQYTGAIWFFGGAHHQTWEGFKFANCKPLQFGVVVFGRLNASQPTVAPHHITMNDCDILASCTSSFAGEGDHAVYIKAATGGVNNITLDGWTVNGSGGINTFIHIYDDSGDGCYDIDVTNFTVTGTHKAIMVWWASAHDLLFQNGVITNATKYAISPYRVGANVVFDNVDSTGSGIAGNEGTVQGSPTINPNCSLG